MMTPREAIVRLQAAGWSMPTIADRVGVSVRTLYRYRDDGTRPRSVWILRQLLGLAATVPPMTTTPSVGVSAA